MAENTRIRIEPHIEAYLKSHAERILDKSSTEKLSVSELSVLANALILEHKQATKMMGAIAQKLPLTNLFTWLSNLVNGNKVVQLNPSCATQHAGASVQINPSPVEEPQETHALKSSDIDEFESDYALNFDVDAA